ncbi:MAG TPA: DUF4386 domain-containing protein [Gemmatimonadaceae bacterium]|nr:DUF4386 domain-containing protein [Gemmatimonadaceae bacterium]
MTAGQRADNIQSYARLAGVLGVLTLVAGGFGEAYVPSAIMVAGDPEATARNIVASESLFRWGFAGYLVEALCDAGLTMAFWVLVRPVHQNLAMGMVVFRIISTCGFAAAMMLWFGALPTLKTVTHLAAAPADQLTVLAYTLLRVSGFGQALFSMFYGVANIIFGTLIYRSGYLPRVFGVGFAIMGIAFTTRTFLLVLAPAYASPLLLVTAGIVFPPFIVWLLVKGVNVDRFYGRAT